MCIIAAKPAGTPMPDRDTIRTMWNVNSDGAGLMWVEKGQVRIEKGFMKYKALANRLDELEKKLDLTATPVVMHFRITTHGGTKPENTHPFPITDSIGALKKRVITTDVGVAHNGIIPITPRKGISDTMEYIATQLAPLKRALPRFYENKHAMQLIQNAIGSKMAFLTREGKIYTVGHFIEDGGMLYSNESYMKLYSYYRSSYYSCYADEDDWATSWNYTGKLTGKTETKDKPTNEPVVEDDARMLMWLDDQDIVHCPDGQPMEGTDFLLDEHEDVWWYDWQADMASAFPGAYATTPEGLPIRYNEDDAEVIYTSPF